MNNRWRFRTGFRGKLILQRYVKWTDWDCYGGSHDASNWRDATSGDLKDYYKDLYEQTHQTQSPVVVQHQELVQPVPL